MSDTLVQLFRPHSVSKWRGLRGLVVRLYATRFAKSHNTEVRMAVLMHATVMLKRKLITMPPARGSMQSAGRIPSCSKASAWARNTVL